METEDGDESGGGGGGGGGWDTPMAATLGDMHLEDREGFGGPSSSSSSTSVAARSLSGNRRRRGAEGGADTLKASDGGAQLKSSGGGGVIPPPSSGTSLANLSGGMGAPTAHLSLASTVAGLGGAHTPSSVAVGSGSTPNTPSVHSFVSGGGEGGSVVGGSGEQHLSGEGEGTAAQGRRIRRRTEDSLPPPAPLPTGLGCGAHFFLTPGALKPGDFSPIDTKAEVIYTLKPGLGESQQSGEGGSSSSSSSSSSSKTQTPVHTDLKEVLGVYKGGPGGCRAGEPQGHTVTDYLQLLDLIYRMLDYDPSSRITPMEALNHPFLRSDIDEAAGVAAGGGGGGGSSSNTGGGGGGGGISSSSSSSSGPSKKGGQQ